MSEKKQYPATPRPWFQVCGNIQGEINKHSKWYICRCGDNGLATEKDVANAKLIVRAVNAHEDLLDACKNMFDVLNKEGFVIKDSKYQKTIQHAVNAIEKAKGN